MPWQVLQLVCAPSTGAPNCWSTAVPSASSGMSTGLRNSGIAPASMPASTAASTSAPSEEASG